MDATGFLNKLYLIRDKLLFFWQNPSALKMDLLANPKLSAKLIITGLILFLLLCILFKPRSKAKKPAINPPQSRATQPKLEAVTPTPQQKTFSKALQQHRREPSLITRPVRSPPKKTKNISVHELSAEEEQTLKEAISIAGKQALAEMIGEPHQTEFFPNTLATDAARKIFSGNIRSKEIEATSDISDKNHLPKAKASEFVLLYYMALRSQVFEGETIFALLRSLGLNLNDQHVFEYIDEEGLQFYVTTAVKPGHFDIHRLHYTLPGLSFVLDLTIIEDAETAFDKMLGCIHTLSQYLTGDILDEKRQRLTQASMHQYMARIKVFNK